MEEKSSIIIIIIIIIIITATTTLPYLSFWSKLLTSPNSCITRSS
jgi:hypothetical protein